MKPHLASVRPNFLPQRIPASMLLVVLAICGPASASASDEAQHVFAQVSPSVVTIIATINGGASVGQGSGVVVGHEQVATNCHVVSDADQLSVRHGAAELSARWIGADRSRDLCLLAVDGLQARPVSVRASASLLSGERVFAVGNPLGFGLSVTSGLVSHFPIVDGEQLILSSAPQSPGSSGGGLFDSEGRLIGLTTSVFSAGQNLNLALPADWINELADRGVQAPLSPEVPSAEPRWVADANVLRGTARWTELEHFARRWIIAQPTSARAHLEFARAVSRLGRTQEAETSLREALRLDDHSAESWRVLAITLHDAGRHSEAEWALARAETLLPGDAGVAALRAHWLLAAGDAQSAKTSIERAIVLDPFSYGNWNLLGSIRRALGEPDAAQRAFQTALDLNGNNAEARNALARLLAEAGRADEAHRALTAGRGDERTDASTWLALGITDYNRQRYVTAEDAFRKAVKADPEFAEGWEKLGMTLARTLRDDELTTVIEHALRLDPTLFEARLERAALRARRGDVAGAASDARHLTEIAPDEPRAWRTLAIHSIAAQDLHTAVEAYRHVDTLGKAGVDDLVDLGDLLGKIGNRGAALEAFARAERIDPRHSRMLGNLASFHGRNGDIEKAQVYLDRALASDPRNANALSSKAYILLLRGQPSAAVSILEQAVLYDPKLANAWINLGHAHLRNRDVGRAIPALEKSLTLAPKALDAQLYLAQAYLSIRDAAKARAYAETILTQHPELPAALGIATLANLMAGDSQRAASAFVLLRKHDSRVAENIRAQALAANLPGAAALPSP